MANVLFGGFHPVDMTRSRARRYHVASNPGTGLFRGDVLTIATTGLVAPAAAGNTDLVGVMKEAEYTSSGKRIRNSYLPSGTTYSGGSFGTDESWVWVWDDPNNEYYVCVDTNTSTDTAAEWEAAIGSNMDITAGAGSTTYRVSGHTLDGSPIAGSAQFRILEVVRRPNRSLTAANLHVRVCINEGFHAFTDGSGI